MSETTNGTLHLHANGQHFLEFTNDGRIVPGPAFSSGDADTALVFRALAHRYPEWLGAAIGHWLRSQQQLDRVALAAVRGATGGVISTNDAIRVFSAIVVELAERATEQGLAAAAQEKERQEAAAAAAPRPAADPAPTAEPPAAA